MLRDRKSHPADPEARILGRRGLVPVGVTTDHVRSAVDFALHQHRADELTPQGAYHYAWALGTMLWVLPFAEQSVAAGAPCFREHPDSSDSAARAWALAYQVVETADLIRKGWA